MFLIKIWSKRYFYKMFELKGLHLILQKKTPVGLFDMSKSSQKSVQLIQK